MANIKFSIEAMMSPPYWKVDKSLRLTFHTGREIKKEELMAILDSAGSEGWLLWAPNEMGPEDIPTEKAEVGEKTKAERLRNVLYALYKESEVEGDFNEFYNYQMERIITKIKQRLGEE